MDIAIKQQERSMKIKFLKLCGHRKKLQTWKAAKEIPARRIHRPKGSAKIKGKKITKCGRKQYTAKQRGMATQITVSPSRPVKNEPTILTTMSVGSSKHSIAESKRASPVFGGTPKSSEFLSKPSKVIINTGQKIENFTNEKQTVSEYYDIGSQSPQETISENITRDDGSDLTRVNKQEQILDKYTLSDIAIESSAEWKAAVDKAQVPFLHHQVLECDCRGLEYTIEDHDITLRFPEGAIPEERVAHVEIGVAAYGPFIYPKDTQPISPIVWLCIVEKDIQLQKPFQLILPHSLVQLTMESIRDHQVKFMKATDNYIITDEDQFRYEFLHCDSEPLFAFSGDKSYAVLESMHCCYHCLKAKKTQKAARDAGYCLTRIEHSQPAQPQLQKSEIYFIVTYFLKTCIKAVEQQFPGYHISRCDLFKFNKPVRTAEISFKEILPHNNQELTVGFEPSTAKIKRADIEFWKSSFEDMKLRHERKVYPPRVKMTITTGSQCLPFTLPVKVAGCSSTDQLDMDITFPLAICASSRPQLDNHSQSIYIEDAKPSLKDAFQELLPLAHQWKSIGALLEIKPHVLENVKLEEKQANDCLLKMLTEWRKLVHPQPTWKNLITAVKRIDEGKALEISQCIAKKIHTQA